MLLAELQAAHEDFTRGLEDMQAEADAQAAELDAANADIARLGRAVQDLEEEVERAGAELQDSRADVERAESAVELLKEVQRIMLFVVRSDTAAETGGIKDTGAGGGGARGRAS